MNTTKPLGMVLFLVCVAVLAGWGCQQHPPEPSPQANASHPHTRPDPKPPVYLPQPEPPNTPIVVVPVVPENTGTGSGSGGGSGVSHGDGSSTQKPAKPLPKLPTLSDTAASKDTPPAPASQDAKLATPSVAESSAPARPVLPPPMIVPMKMSEPLVPLKVSEPGVVAHVAEPVVQAKPEPPALPGLESKPEAATAPPAEIAAAEKVIGGAGAPADAAALAKVPQGLPPLHVPENNPLTAEKVELGRMLYFDKRVSRDGTISCATCHDPQMAWTEHSSTSTGIDKQVGNRNSPTVINAAYATTQFWDGRAGSLEEQALGPVENPIEMGHSLPVLMEQLKKIPQYQERFQKVFGGEINKENFAKAIAAFERTILSGNSAYDKFVAGDTKALSDAQKRGWEKFRISCAGCHTAPLFSNYEFYNAGIGMDKADPDPGRKKVTGRDRDLGKFRVPALRDVAKTAPYFHDGSATTLEEAVTVMAQGGRENSKLSSMLKAVRDDHLTAEDIKDLVAFLEALSGEYPVIDAPPLP